MTKFGLLKLYFIMAGNRIMKYGIGQVVRRDKAGYGGNILVKLYFFYIKIMYFTRSSYILLQKVVNIEN